MAEDLEYKELLQERALVMAYNSGLEMAVWALEEARNLSPEEHDEIIEAIKQEIVDSEVDCSLKLLSCDRGNGESTSAPPD